MLLFLAYAILLHSPLVFGGPEPPKKWAQPPDRVHNGNNDWGTFSDNDRNLFDGPHVVRVTKVNGNRGFFSFPKQGGTNDYNITYISVRRGMLQGDANMGIVKGGIGYKFVWLLFELTDLSSQVYNILINGKQDK